MVKAGGWLLIYTHKVYISNRRLTSYLQDVYPKPNSCSDEHDVGIYIKILCYNSLHGKINQDSCQNPDDKYWY